MDPNLNLNTHRELVINLSTGLFDLPLIDSTRLSFDERCTLAVTQPANLPAGLRLAYYPGTRASFRDKRFIDDMPDEVRHSTDCSKGKAP